METVETTINNRDAVLLLHELSEDDKPVSLNVGECDYDAGENVIELYVNHEHDHVPDLRYFLRSDGTGYAKFNLISKD